MGRHYLEIGAAARFRWWCVAAWRRRPPNVTAVPFGPLAAQKPTFNWTSNSHYTAVYIAWLSRRPIAAHPHTRHGVWPAFLVCFQRIVWVLTQASLIYARQLASTFGVLGVAVTRQLRLRYSGTAAICEMVGRPGNILGQESSFVLSRVIHPSRHLEAKCRPTRE